MSAQNQVFMIMLKL